MDRNKRRWIAREEGQAIVTLALMSTFLLAILGIGIDSGIIWMQRRSLQTVADAAALAGVQALQCNGGGTSQAEAAAVDWAGRNDPDAAVVATANGAQKSLHVRVEKPAGTMLLGMFGIVDPDVPAEASAALDCTTTGSMAGLFAIDSSCSSPRGITVSGILIFIRGSTHSNSEVRVEGSFNSFDGVSNTHRCGSSGFSEGFLSFFNDYDPPFVAQTAIVPTPLDRTIYDAELLPAMALPGSCPPGGVTIPSGNVGQRPPGIYCATGNMTVNHQNLNSNPAGTVTLIAGGNITVSGSSKNLRNVKLIARGNIVVSGTGHDLDDVTLRANGRVEIVGALVNLTSPDTVSIYSASSASDAIEVSGFASGITNCLFAPVGEIDIFGAFSALVGCVVGWRIDIDAAVAGDLEVDPSSVPGGWTTEVRTYQLTQ